MVDADHDRAARVRPSRLGPTARDHGEVLDVERDEDPPFAGSDRQQLLVGEAVQRPLLVGGADIVAALAERGGDAPCRDVRVEEQLHRASGARLHIDTADGNERKFFFELLDRPPVFGYSRVDLLGKHLVVIKRQFDLALVGGAALRHPLDRPDVTMRVDDLPHIERSADHPRTPIPVNTTESDSRETAAGDTSVVHF